MTQKGKFIVIDGTDGAGKSTMTTSLVENLESRGINVVRTREPGGTPFAEKIRELLLWHSADNEEKVDSQTELLLMFASRNQHLQARIIPELDKGSWVVCERYTSSTYAYQGFARGLGTEKILQMDKDFCKISPDLTLIFDVSPELSRSRTEGRGQLDHFEREKLQFFEKVREGYHHYAENCRENCQIIDASKSMIEVKKDMIAAVKSNLKITHENPGISMK